MYFFRLRFSILSMGIFVSRFRMTMAMLMMPSLGCIYLQERKWSSCLGNALETFSLCFYRLSYPLPLLAYSSILLWIYFVIRSCTLLTCTEKGKASIRSFEVTTSTKEFASTGSSRSWEVCNAGNILCSKLDGSENYALFGGWVFPCCKNQQYGLENIINFIVERRVITSYLYEMCDLFLSTSGRVLKWMFGILTRVLRPGRQNL